MAAGAVAVLAARPVGVPAIVVPPQARASGGRLAGVLEHDADGSGAAVLLMHGFPLDRSIWDAQVEALAETHRVITPDLRGFGASDFGGILGRRRPCRPALRRRGAIVS